MGFLVQLSTSSNQLLDFTQKLDIDLLDNVVVCMHAGIGTQQKTAQEVLTTLKDHPDAWTRVDTILQYSNNSETKYFALQILENVITTRWKILPRSQCDGIKKFIVGLIIKTSSESDSLDKQKVYLCKLNMILVQILKYEWPNNWPSFISEIVGASKTNESLCQNNMVIMKLLSEEVFDFSSGKLTQAKAKYLKSAMCKEFSNIFTLCVFVLENSQNAQLVSVTLETLLRFLNWIPLGYIYETKLISTLAVKFLNVPLFTNVTLMCLTEIGSVKVNQYNEQFLELFSLVMTKLKEMLPLVTNIRHAYKNGRHEEQTFIQNLSLFLCQFLRTHGELVEKSPDHAPLLFEALHYLLLISEVDDIEIFKICLEYWCVLASELYSYHETNYNDSSMLINRIPASDEPKNRRHIYKDVLSKLRHVMISRMAKPEEVLVVENDQGEVVREFLKDTDSISMYKNMRETLVYLTHLDYADTEMIMTEKLHNQVNGTEWSWKNLNTLCWAIGSISGAFLEEDEKRFLVMVIKDLLGLCEQKRGKDNKAIIASNIMYVVGQYPRFLRAHWRFLRTVVNKLFEFMHETHDGVQDMACDTFIKISQKCRRHFIQIQVGEMMPFIEEILNSISTIICDLNQQQIHTFYESVGIMISAQMDQVTCIKLIEKYMSLPNGIWDSIISLATADVQCLKDIEVVKQLSNIIKTNLRACKSLNNNYVTQLGRIYLDMLNVYKVMSENLNQAIKANGETITKQPLLKAMRTVRKDILKLMSLYISLSTDSKMIQENFLGPLLETILPDYNNSSPCAREPEVLVILRTIIDKLQALANDKIYTIFNSVFECTLNMINKDFQEYPEHRINFYLLIKSSNQYCFKALLELSPETFKLLFDSVIWSIKHTMRDVAETGLTILHKMLQNISAEPQAAQMFYHSYFTDILQHIFSVVTDSSHMAGLSMQSMILSYLFNLLDTNKITVLLGNCTSPDQNQPYIQEYLANLLTSAFPHLNKSQIKIFIEGLFSFDQDLNAFKDHLRDFLVEIREFSGQDNSDLFLEEKEAEIQQAHLAKRTKQLAVPGIVGPHEDEMQDM